MRHLRRREFVGVLGSAALWPLAVHAQQPDRIKRIAVLNTLPPDDQHGQERVGAFLQGLQQAGWTIGNNLRVDQRWWAAGNPDVMHKHAGELVALAPDAILATGGVAVRPLRQVTRTIPIVFCNTPDPVSAGFVDSVARPGGNMTGFTQFEYSVSVKWLELMKQIAPGITRVGVLRDPGQPSGIGQLAAIQGAAASFGVELVPARRARRSRNRAGPGKLRAPPIECRPDSDHRRTDGRLSRAD
jgi:putative ABC transport system substrate-binding protein